jgi:hypothetical protein
VDQPGSQVLEFVDGIALRCTATVPERHMNPLKNRKYHCEALFVFVLYHTNNDVAYD